MQAPKHKAESTDYFKRGVYGNNIEQWENPDEALASGKRSFVIRYRGEPGVQGPALFGIPGEVLIMEWNKLLGEGNWEESRLYVNEEVDRHKITLQGELLLNHDDGWLFRGCLGGGRHMREAMSQANCQTWRGWQARELLRSKMHPSSWDDLNCLIDMWPDAVIELVTMSTAYGSLAHTGRNMICWEVREDF